MASADAQEHPALWHELTDDLWILKKRLEVQIKEAEEQGLYQECRFSITAREH